MPKTVNVKTSRDSSDYDVKIAAGALKRAGEWAASNLERTGKVCVVSNKKVFGLYGRQLSKTLASIGFEVSVHLIGDGERFKNLKTLGSILEAFSGSGISRTDAVIGFGGGVVGDIAGFAASIHLRGVDFLQIPTTLLAMVDSSVGGKTAINTKFGKNLAGTFYQPKGVLIDPEALLTLQKREVTAGLCECIKHAALAGERLLEQTVAALDSINQLKTKRLSADFDSFLAAQIAFKAKIVKADERESITISDTRSRKILNFGHTFAHAMEKSSNYGYLKHGEAVGYGILFAAELSKKLGLLDGKVVNLLCDVVHRAGNLPRIDQLDPKAVYSALRHDKKFINDSLQWILLKDIGQPVIVPQAEIGDKIIRSTIKEFLASK